ncbi:TRAP transporter small permease [Seohaeicola nanhaiensis]|uniref:TRAP transporter small permease protein n=1 Tax=Seohaeicola nanhaiensis TaxID=1387282 RepID=A0ABV9KLM5_9RHOB
MLKRIETAISIIAAVLLFLLMIITFIDVIGRNFFNRPLNGAAELTELMLASTVFLMLPLIAIRQKHIVVDLLDFVGNRIFKAAQTVIGVAVGVFLFGMMAWRLFILAESTARYNDLTPTLKIPIAPLVYGMSLFSGLTAIAFVGLAVTMFRSGSKRPVGQADAPGELAARSPNT